MSVALASFGSGPAFAADGLHEVYAAGQAEAVCLSGCLLAMGGAGGTGALLWVRQAEQNREAGMPSAAGLRELGIDPGRVVLVLPRDPLSALQAALEGARCRALGGVVLELWGEVRPYDLTASRRLALAARESGVPVLVARTAAAPTPSAAETRWQVRALASRALPARAPGLPALELVLLRDRSGREGLCYQLEWDRDVRQFRLRDADAVAVATAPRRAAPLSGAVVPLAPDGPAAAARGRRRQTG